MTYDVQNEQHQQQSPADPAYNFPEVQKPSKGVNNTYAVEPPMAKNAKGKPVNAAGKVVKRVMPTDQPLTFWYKRKGYNDFLFLEGDKMGPTAYYVDVRANPAGWNIFLKCGATIEAPTVLHITKGIRLLWDKGTPVRIEIPETEQEVTTMFRKYEFVNKYVFTYNGRMYTWEWMELFGGCHYLKDAETHEVICIARFKFTIALQILSAWGLRLRGGVEIYGAGKQMVDVVMATLAAQIEWRKHNNKLLNIWTTIPFL